MKKIILPLVLLILSMCAHAQVQTPFIFRPAVDGTSGMTLLQQNNPGSGWSFSVNNDGVFRVFRTDKASSIFSLDHWTGNFGIGTDNPKSKLVIADTGEKNAMTFATEDGIGCLGFNRNVVDGYIFNKTITAWQFTARSERFSLEGYNGASTHLLDILKNGNIGVGTIEPQYKLDVIGTFRAHNILAVGNVGIGTDNPKEMLDVAGTIRAREVKIEINAGADHVFNKNYDLKPLSELEAFVKENKHLPEIQSERQMQEEGLNINEFQIKLLQKIEELTLYVINQDKTIKEQGALLDKQNKLIENLQDRFDSEK